MQRLTLILALGLLISGCSQKPTKLTWSDPAAAASKAIESYDGNDDKQLSADELKKCPAFSDNLRRLDTNHDGKLSVDEIKARFDEHAKWIKYLALEPTIMSKGRPAAGVQLTLTPEPFMGEAFPTFTGTTGNDGTCTLTGDGRYFAGVPVGFYTLKIVSGGKETLRGVEVASDTTGSRLEIAL